MTYLCRDEKLLFPARPLYSAPAAAGGPS